MIICRYKLCEAFQACFQLRMNIVETPADEDAEYTGRTGRVKSYVRPPSGIRIAFGHLRTKTKTVQTPKTAHVLAFKVPLGYGMLYQQSIELPDAWHSSLRHDLPREVQINWTPVSNFNCKFIAVGKWRPQVNL